MAVTGAGNFTQAMILPMLKELSAPVRTVISASGVSGTHLAQKYGIPQSSTNFEAVAEGRCLGTVLITTRHNLHAAMTAKALEAGKDVFVEKPLALNENELQEIIEAVNNGERAVTVGFNRRFSPFTRKMKSLLGTDPLPLTIIATMNAGEVPPGEWVHDPEIGGGRIIGEACHFVDLISYLAGSPVDRVCMEALGRNPEGSTDVAAILLKYANGALGVINYFANGHKAYPRKESRCMPRAEP